VLGRWGTGWAYRRTPDFHGWQAGCCGGFLLLAFGNHTDRMQAVFTQGGHQCRPVDPLFDLPGVDHDRFVLEKGAGVLHTPGQGIEQRSGVGVVQDDAYGVQGRAFEIERQRCLAGRCGRAHFC